MAEGPQVRRRTEWLHKHLAGRTVLRCDSTRLDIPADAVTGRRIERVFCKGKHIFVELAGGMFLHNHLLMRGSWKKLEGQQLFLPPNAWLALYVGPYTVCNLGGQMLRLVDQADVDRQLAALGPDAMAEPFPENEIVQALRASSLPIAEALLDQTLVAGIGNIAKSEVLFSAGVTPQVPAKDLDDSQMACLLDEIREVLRASYRNGGRWVCRIYRRAGQFCTQCGTSIRTIALPPSRRTTYFCPHCQK